MCNLISKLFYFFAFIFSDVQENTNLSDDELEYLLNNIIDSVTYKTRDTQGGSHPHVIGNIGKQ